MVLDLILNSFSLFYKLLRGQGHRSHQMLQLEPYLNSKIKTGLLCCYRFKPYNKSHFLREYFAFNP